MDKIVVEVGSTCTKVDKYDGEKIVHLKTLPIEFKKNFKKENKLNSDDINKLIELVNSFKEYKDIFVFCISSVVTFYFNHQTAKNNKSGGINNE